MTNEYRAAGGRLVVVSNRLADPRKPAAGGLAVAVGDALAATGGHEEDLVENARVVGGHLLARLHELEGKYPGLVSNARGKGLFCAIDLPDGKTRTALRTSVFEKGVVILGSGEKSIRFRPPLNIRKEEIDEAIAVIDGSMKTL